MAPRVYDRTCRSDETQALSWWVDHNASESDNDKILGMRHWPSQSHGWRSQGIITRPAKSVEYVRSHKNGAEGHGVMGDQTHGYWLGIGAQIRSESHGSDQPVATHDWIRVPASKWPSQCTSE